MMQVEINEGKLKQVFKEALLEMLEEKTDFFQGIIMEAMEDVALSRAISEGEATENTDREEVFDILKGRA